MDFAALRAGIPREMTLHRRATAQRDREHPPDTAGKLSRRNQPAGYEQGGKL
jgi:hypothetical protein